MKTIAQQLNIKTFPFEIKDSDGNRIYFEWSDGVWSKYERNGRKVIRYENSKGYWEKREWVDDKVIRYEDSKGFWVKREYAGGEMIYWEDSNGIIMDNRPKTDVQKAIDLLTKEGLIVNGQILKN